MSTLYFKTPGIAAVWLCEIRGQFSDGVFENHSAWERTSTREILYEFLSADAKVGSGKHGIYLSNGEHVRCPLSGTTCLDEFLAYLYRGNNWAWRVVVYYTLGELYGINIVKKLYSCCIDELATYLITEAWGYPHFYLKSERARKLAKANKIINVEDALAKFKQLNPHEMLTNLRRHADELDDALG